MCTRPSNTILSSKTRMGFGSAGRRCKNEPVRRRAILIPAECAGWKCKGDNMIDNDDDVRLQLLVANLAVQADELDGENEGRVGGDDGAEATRTWGRLNKK